MRAFRAVGGDPVIRSGRRTAPFHRCRRARIHRFRAVLGRARLGHVIQRYGLHDRRWGEGPPTASFAARGRVGRAGGEPDSVVEWSGSFPVEPKRPCRRSVSHARLRREMIIKFDGAYHGHADSFLVAAGSGVATFGLPDCPAYRPIWQSSPYRSLQRRGRRRETLTATPGRGDHRRAVPRYVGFIPPADGFLAALRSLATEAGALLIFDEVITGFRVHAGGAQALCGVMPDLTTLGKIIGGGLPVGAYGGRRDLMERVAPAGNATRRVRWREIRSRWRPVSRRCSSPGRPASTIRWPNAPARWWRASGPRRTPSGSHSPRVTVARCGDSSSIRARSAITPPPSRRT